VEKQRELNKPIMEGREKSVRERKRRMEKRF
jgi:hypothetical protein